MFAGDSSEHKEEETNKTNTNYFECFTKEYKDIKKYIDFRDSRISNKKTLLCCTDVRQNLDKYCVLTEDEINKGLQQNKIYYEVIYGFKYIKPYINIDISTDYDDDFVINTFENIIKTIKSKLSYVFGGYTSIASINEKYKFIELKDSDKTHKKLSLRIFAYKYAIDINKSLGFWFEYVGLNKDLIVKKIINTSIYKAADKQQKLKLLQCNKTNQDSDSIKNYYIIDRDNKELHEGSVFSFNYLAITWTDGTKLFDSSKLTDNETLKRMLKINNNKINTKDNKEITEQEKEQRRQETLQKVLREREQRKQERLQIEQRRQERKQRKQEMEQKRLQTYDEITPLFDENTLLDLLNLFPYEFESVKVIIPIISKSPYPINILKRVCYKWYNQREHRVGDATEGFIDKYYGYTHNNIWFWALMNRYYKPKNKSKGSLTKEELEKRNNRKRFIKLFYDIEENIKRHKYCQDY